MVTLQDFLNKYLGETKGYPTDSQYNGECLSIVKLYVKECFGIDPPPSGTNSAYGYWLNFPSPLDTVFEKVINTEEAVITKGSIPIWKPTKTNSAGHIEICIKDGNLNDFESAGQNWGGREFHIQTHNYEGIAGWLKPKIINSSPAMTDEETRILEFVRLNKITEAQIRQGYGYITDNIEKTVSDLKDQVATLTNSADIMATKLIEEQKVRASQQSLLEAARKELDEVKLQTLEAAPTGLIFKELFNRLINLK